MVNVVFDPTFQKQIAKLGDALLLERVKKQIRRIVRDPEIGKPMMHSRKGTRDVRVPPFRLSYAYVPSENLIEFLEIYHKDEQ